MSSKIEENCVIKEVAEKSYQPRRLTGAIRGVLSGLSAQGEPLVDFCGNSAARELVAVATVPVRQEDIGKEAILLFEDGDPARPLLVGLVQPPAAPLFDASKKVEVTVDGRRLTLTAQDEISLRCGEASITLTSAGKVLIKGTYLLSKATGPNRIKGGSVQLN
jgi:hypothetical protein